MPSAPWPGPLPKKRASLPTSSSSTDRPPFDDAVLVGRLGRPHGLDGGVTVELATDSPEQRFASGNRVFLSDGASLELVSSRQGDKGWVLRFEGFRDRSAAESLRNERIYVHSDDLRSLSDDEFWPDDLVGAAAILEGEAIGRVTAVEIGSGQDRLHILTEEGELIVPFVGALVPEVDTEGGKVILDLPAGFRDPE